MISHMNNTTSADVGMRLETQRETEGTGALGRVLTLIIMAKTEGGVRDALQAAGGASRAHPSRIIVVLPGESEKDSLDAEIRTGTESGASEVIILRANGRSADNVKTLVMPLLLPDTPVVTWWIQEIPENCAATDAGSIAQRRITTARTSHEPVRSLVKLRHSYTPGDTDLSWAGCSLWRNYLASMLDEFPGIKLVSARVNGTDFSGSVYLLAAWLRLLLDIPVEIIKGEGSVINSVYFETDKGETLGLERSPGTDFATMIRPGRKDQMVALNRRDLADMLIEDLRDLTPDYAYEQVLTKGLELLDYPAFQN